MKMHTPLFVIGLLTFITPFLGFPSNYESIIIAAYGIAVMLIVSSIKLNKNDGLSEPMTVIESEEEIIIEEVPSESKMKEEVVVTEEELPADNADAEGEEK